MMQFPQWCALLPVVKRAQAGMVAGAVGHNAGVRGRHGGKSNTSLAQAVADNGSVGASDAAISTAPMSARKFVNPPKSVGRLMETLVRPAVQAGGDTAKNIRKGAAAKKLNMGGLRPGAPGLKPMTPPAPAAPAAPPKAGMGLGPKAAIGAGAAGLGGLGAAGGAAMLGQGAGSSATPPPATPAVAAPKPAPGPNPNPFAGFSGAAQALQGRR